MERPCTVYLDPKTVQLDSEMSQNGDLVVFVYLFYENNNSL